MVHEYLQRKRSTGDRASRIIQKSSTERMTGNAPSTRKSFPKNTLGRTKVHPVPVSGKLQRSAGMGGPAGQGGWDAITAFSQYWHCAGIRSRQARSRHSRRKSQQAIQNIWFHKDFAANNSTREMLYEKLQLLAEMNGWNYIPSYQSVTRYINYLMTEGGMGSAHYLAARGYKEYKNRKVVKASRDTGAFRLWKS